ncbi:MAG TPA: glucokinase, partial [bacterium]|nr:glucokinase [bacterium]
AEICREALRIWTGALAAEAGSLVLRSFAVGGVYLGGGIPPQIVPALKSGDFLETFRRKEPFRDVLAEVPVRVVTAPELSLRGAARVALEIAREA